MGRWTGGRSANASRYYAAVAVGIWLATWEAGCEALGLRGRFVALPPEARGGEEGSALAKYDVSWIPENWPTAQ